MDTRELRIDLQVLGRSGHYPFYQIRAKNHLFVATPEVVWCAVRHQEPRAHFNDIAIFTHYPEEIRLLAAISLAAGDPWSDGRFSICPWLREELDYDSVPPFSKPIFLRYCTGRAKRLARSTDLFDYDPFPKGRYSLGNQGSEGTVLELLEAIDVEDELLLAGLSRFLSAQRLALMRSFFEEACLFGLLSLDAVLEYMRQCLEGEMNRKVDFSEVYSRIAAEFPDGADVAACFKEMYENRIILVHPSSRFGESITAPMFQHDCWHLIKWLVLLYRYVLLGELPEEEP
jgi:hypothetical protein